jgi:hypothetical protein
MVSAARGRGHFEAILVHQNKHAHQHAMAQPGQRQRLAAVQTIGAYVIMRRRAPEVPNDANRGSLRPIATHRQVAKATTRTTTRKHMATISKKMSHIAPTIRLKVWLMRSKWMAWGE